jgi:precorrin-2 dehydrogenase/sirohydrochlorin ferrochelatase
MDRAGQLFREALAKGSARRGTVRFIAGKGPADLLTLRAVRALGAADVLVLDGDAEPEVVKMARRDVERVDAAGADAEHLVQLAREGRQIVRLITQAVDPALIHALTQAEVSVEVLPVATA